MSSTLNTFELNDVWGRVAAGEDVSSGTFSAAGGIFRFKMYKESLTGRPAIALEALTPPPNALHLTYILKFLNSENDEQLMLKSRHDFTRQRYFVYQIGEIYTSNEEFFPQGNVKVQFGIQHGNTDRSLPEQRTDQESPYSFDDQQTTAGFSQLAAEVSSFCMNSRYSDCSLVSSDGHTLPGHRLILASRCAFLANQLQEFGPLRDINVPFDVPVLTEILHFLYGATVSSRDLKKLFAAANTLGLTDLKDYLRRLLMRDITTDNLGAFMILADKCADAEIEDACLEILRRNFDSIKLSHNWRDFKVAYHTLAIKYLEKR